VKRQRRGLACFVRSYDDSGVVGVVGTDWGDLEGRGALNRLPPPCLPSWTDLSAGCSRRWIRTRYAAVGDCTGGELDTWQRADLQQLDAPRWRRRNAPADRQGRQCGDVTAVPSQRPFKRSAELPFLTNAPQARCARSRCWLPASALARVSRAASAALKRRQGAGCVGRCQILEEALRSGASAGARSRGWNRLVKAIL